MKFILKEFLMLLLVIVLFIVGLVILSVYWGYVTFANLVTRTREWIRL